MVNLPPSILDPVFDGQFQRGSIIRTVIQFSDGNKKYKYIIVVNHDCVKDPVLFFLTTSQMDFYNKNPQFNRDIVRIKPGKISIFPQETVINCREIHKLHKDDLKRNFKDNVLEFVGKLSDDLIRDIDGIVRESYFLSKRDKDLILGDNEK